MIRQRGIQRFGRARENPFTIGFGKGAKRVVSERNKVGQRALRRWKVRAPRDAWRAELGNQAPEERFRRRLPRSGAHKIALRDLDVDTRESREPPETIGGGVRRTVLLGWACEMIEDHAQAGKPTQYVL